MKLLLFTVVVAVISSVNGGKTARLLAAMNAGMLNGMMGGGLNPPLMVGGGMGLVGQPQFAQLVPGLPAALAVRAPIPNMFPAAINPYQLPMMGAPQMPQMNPPQQFPMGMAVGAMQQQPPFQPLFQPLAQPQVQPQVQSQVQPPVQPDPLRRFRRQTVKSENSGRPALDTQIPRPAESTKAPPCGNKAAN
ncbi:secretory calcium-binding phosphoprotein 9 [Cyprinodon tularosa]|uniref:cell division protein ZipA-like n=1 Tax=Cyprinodon variegatus TaxID=28743 RepID=UPI0007426E6F|nr:PREDICTED: cell division protein ZipA-like [Cyprinodon variegatus]XP_038128342.1 secretory calcium-binding phosphoprotein 9 [Cyprinodon tularosa]